MVGHPFSGWATDPRALYTPASEKARPLGSRAVERLGQAPSRAGGGAGQAVALGKHSPPPPGRWPHQWQQLRAGGGAGGCQHGALKPGSKTLRAFRRARNAQTCFNLKPQQVEMMRRRVGFPRVRSPGAVGGDAHLLERVGRAVCEPRRLARARRRRPAGLRARCQPTAAEDSLLSNMLRRRSDERAAAWLQW